VDVHGGTLEAFFLEYDHGKRPSTKKYYSEPHHPSVSLMDVQKDFGENERNKGNRHGVELALLGFDCQVASGGGDERVGFKVAKVNLPLPDGRLRRFLEGKEDCLEEGLLMPAKKKIKEEGL
jgi:hypothetical protein